MVIVVARQRTGIALMKVLPAPESAGRAMFIHYSFTNHSLRRGRGMPHARAAAKLDR